jgi:hypothetical protein
MRRVTREIRHALRQDAKNCAEIVRHVLRFVRQGLFADEDPHALLGIVKETDAPDVVPRPGRPLIADADDGRAARADVFVSLSVEDVTGHLTKRFAHAVRAVQVLVVFPARIERERDETAIAIVVDVRKLELPEPHERVRRDPIVRDLAGLVPDEGAAVTRQKDDAGQLLVRDRLAVSVERCDLFEVHADDGAGRSSARRLSISNLTDTRIICRAFGLYCADTCIRQRRGYREHVNCSARRKPETTSRAATKTRTARI